MRNLNRKRLLAWNTGASLLNQIITVICGFIVPVLILQAFGSAVNGLVNSISQFLAFIGMIELGIGAVTQSALYKPLAEKDNLKISQIYISARKFYRLIAMIMLVYIVGLMIVYPYFVSSEFDYLYTVGLIICIAISLFAQYYFGIVNQVLLNADQRGYIQLLIGSGTMLINTVACVFLIYENCGIHMVKLIGSLIFVLRPILMSYYVNRHYKINLEVTYEAEPISQKWHGIAQHFSAVTLGATGTMVLTCFSSLINVSIYTVYNMVVSSIANMIISMGSGVRALIGELWARCEIEKLKHLIAWTEWTVHTSSVFIFGCTMMLVMPFVLVYTKNVVDADYAKAWFAVLITLANLGMCIRIPYHITIQAAGHYKETQSCYIIATLINIMISILAVKEYGLVGVALGMLCAMCYQTIWMANYISKELIKWPMKNFIKQVIVDVLTLLLVYFVANDLHLAEKTYFEWCIMALKVMGIVFVIQCILNMMFYRYYVVAACNKIVGYVRGKII